MMSSPLTSHQSIPLPRPTPEPLSSSSFSPARRCPPRPLSSASSPSTRHPPSALAPFPPPPAAGTRLPPRRQVLRGGEGGRRGEARRGVDVRAGRRVQRLPSPRWPRHVQKQWAVGEGRRAVGLERSPRAQLHPGSLPLGNSLCGERGRLGNSSHFTSSASPPPSPHLPYPAIVAQLLSACLLHLQVEKRKMSILHRQQRMSGCPGPMHRLAPRDMAFEDGSEFRSYLHQPLSMPSSIVCRPGLLEEYCPAGLADSI